MVFYIILVDSESAEKNINLPANMFIMLLHPIAKD